MDLMIHAYIRSSLEAESKASLSYIASSRSASATEWDLALKFFKKTIKKKTIWQNSVVMNASLERKEKV